jgi:hypothetical protein
MIKMETRKNRRLLVVTGGDLTAWEGFTGGSWLSKIKTLHYATSDLPPVFSSLV